MGIYGRESDQWIGEFTAFFMLDLTTSINVI